ncbi:DUF4157 domain-containing protein [bacterium]|nr:DUF4157 domain-containing protein [bacterium]
MSQDAVGREDDPVREEEEEQDDRGAGMGQAMVARMGDPETEEEEDLQARFMQLPHNDGRENMQKLHNIPASSTGGLSAGLQRMSIGMHPSDVVQRSGRGPPRADRTFEHRLQSSTGGGNPLPGSTREYMESRFGADFSGVRVHTDARAQEMNRDIHAHAFTHGGNIYFNSGKYDPDSSAGKTLLAHELTHTIQQGASPVQNSSSAAVVQRRVQRSAVTGELQRSASPPHLEHAVKLAQQEEGKVIANDVGPDGFRVGWERLIEYFETSFGKDKIVDAPTGVPGTVWRGHIKKKAEVQGQIPNQSDPNETELRDAMPSWCGIFVFWSLNKSGIPMPKWTLGESMIPPEAAYPPGYMPRAGDIAYRKRRSHFGIVVRTEGGRIVSVNGNTAGSDNLGGEVQEQTHTPEQWDGFFNPLAVMEGNLRAPENGDAETEPRSLRDLRREKFGAQRKADGEEEHEAEQSTSVDYVESGMFVNADGCLQCSEEQEQEEEEELQRDALSPVVEYVAVPDDEEDDIQRQAEEEEEEQLQTKSVQRSEVASRIRRVMPSRPSHVQASWFGDAWDAVSGVVSEAAAYIEEGIDAAKDWLLGKVRDFVVEIPGYKLLRVILEYDPITGESFPRTGPALLTAVLDLIPAGESIVRPVLEYFQAITPVSIFLLSAVNSFIGMIASVSSRFERFWDDLSIDDVADPDAVIDRIANLFRSVVTSIVDFAVGTGEDFLTMVKDIAITNVVRFVREYFPNAFELLCVILGENPVTKEPVARNGTNILNAGLAVLGEYGAQIRRQMMENGIFQQCVAWIDRSISVVTDSVADIAQAFTNIWEELSFDSLFHPVDTFVMIVDNFRRPVTRVTTFIRDAVVALAGILRDALLDRLSRFAGDARGYFLITVILGRDVFTGRGVPRNAENLIHGFMSLMEGGEEQFQQMKQSGAIDRTLQKINAAVRRLNFTLEYIVGLFTGLWESMSWNDFLRPFTVFGRIVATFGRPVRRLISFIGTIVGIVVETLLAVMNFPIDLIRRIISKVMEVIDSVKRDPIGFLKNLLRAIKQGFVQFFDNILSHLLTGLSDWFFHQLGELGIEKPEDLSFRSILKLIMQILGITLEQIMEKVWTKLAEKIGQEKVDRIRSMIDRLEGIWSFIKDVMERGPIAIWEYIQEKLSNLWTMVLDAAKGWIMEKIIGAVVTKLLSMLDPTGIMAVINSAIALYRAIQSFIEYLRQMLEIVNSFVTGIAEIAAGNIRSAADFLERTMARGIPIVIGFLANQVGLGRIGRKMAEIIGVIREKVDSAIDWLIDKAINLGARFLQNLRRIGSNVVGAIRRWLGVEKRFTAADGSNHRLYLGGTEDHPTLMMQSTPTTYHAFISAVQIGEGEDAAAKQAAKERAMTIAANVDTVLQAPLEGSTDEEKKASKAAKVEEVERLLTQLGQHTGILFGGGPAAVEESVIEHQPATAGPDTFGRFARGYKLARGKFEAGSVPTQARHTTYDILNLRRQSGGASFYIRGHLLNHNLGGKGLWYNMTPLSRAGNHQHEAQVESAVKAAVDSGAIVEYTVRPDYSARGTAAGLKQAFAARGDPHAEVKGRIVDAEERVPTAMQCDAHILERDGESFRQTQLIVSKSVPNPIEQDAGAYYLAGDPPPDPVFLDSSTRAVLAATTGIGDTLAGRIEEARGGPGAVRRFGSYVALSEARKEDDTAVFSPAQKQAVLRLQQIEHVRLFRSN